MTDTAILEFFTLFLIGYVVCALAQYSYILYYNKKGIKFLQDARDIIFKRNDKEEFDKISKNDLPALIDLSPSLLLEIFIIFTVLAMNCVTYMFALVPESQTTSAWPLLTYISSAGTAYIVLSVHDSKTLIPNINAICGSYNIILESYKHIDEYKEKDDDSSDGL